jgi:hypothetical protein
MIVRGDFETVSMAIYGDVVSDTPPKSTTYSPISLPTHSSVPLVPALDAAKSNDPTALARSLLALIPNAPSLSLVIRLMFCLKQPNDDWELPEFPHLYSDLNEEEMDIDLDTAFRCLSRPVVDDVSSEQLHRFARKVAEAVGPRVCLLKSIPIQTITSFRRMMHNRISLQAFFLALLRRLLNLRRL